MISSQRCFGLIQTLAKVTRCRPPHQIQIKAQSSYIPSPALTAHRSLMPTAQKIAVMAATKGVTVVCCSSSEEALCALSTGPLQKHRALPPNKFRIMSNRSRPDAVLGSVDQEAGLKFSQEARMQG